MAEPGGRKHGDCGEGDRAVAAERAATGGGAGECPGGLPAAWHQPDAVLRVQETIPDARDRGTERPAADPQEPSADDAACGRGEAPGLGGQAPDVGMRTDKPPAEAGGDFRFKPDDPGNPQQA